MAQSPAMTIRTRHAQAGAAFLLVAVLLAACGSATPTVAPATGAPSSASVPVTPAPGSESPARTPAAAAICDQSTTGGPAATADTNDPNAATYGRIEGEVQQLRGLKATTPVARGVFDKAGLCAYLSDLFRKSNPAEQVRATETMLKQLLLIPPDTSLSQLNLDLYASQAIGLYDKNSKHMYVVSQDGAIGPFEEITYAHEYTHALQDQAFNLKALQGDAVDQGDRTLARTALIEGDAYLLMTLWAQQHLKPDELLRAAGATDPTSQAALASLPAIIKEPLISMYTTGLAVAVGAYAKGGFDAVDALEANPPDSTEQILHADKLASREAPVSVTFPGDLAGRLGAGWKVSTQDTLGELQLGIILREGGATAPLDAAAGWGGDRIALLEGSDGKVVVVLDTAWDTSADADQFAAALDPMVAKLKGAGHSVSVLRPAEKRVVLISAESADTVGRVANVLGLAQ
jgi:hypothetical protein